MDNLANLIGESLIVIISEEDETELGIVTEIIETGANHVLLVRRQGKSDLLIPDIDPVVLNINLGKGEMLVRLIPGLIPDDQQ